MSNEEIIQQAIQCAKSGDNNQAARMITQVVRSEPDNARAWYLLSQVVEEKERAIYCLERVLAIQPDNIQAKERLDRFQTSAPQVVADPLPAAEPGKEAPALFAEKTGKNRSNRLIIGGLISLVVLCIMAVVGYFVFTTMFEQKQINPQDVLTAFRSAGLEAENSRQMTKDDYGLAPLADEGIRFYIPSICTDCGGRIMFYTDAEYLDKAKTYYDTLGKESAAFFSWAFVNDHILVQINGDLPESEARKYESILMSMGQ